MRPWLLALAIVAIPAPEGCETDPTPTPFPSPTPDPTPTAPDDPGAYRGCEPGYLGTGLLPRESHFSDSPQCHITPEELRDTYGVVPGDEIDDTEGLQAAIEDLDGCGTGYGDLALLELPAGQLITSRQIALDTSFMVLRGQGSDPESPTSTRIRFTPDGTTRYTPPDDYEEGEFEVADMQDPSGDGKGGWIWPGRGAFRVQTTDVHSRYEDDYADATEAYDDLYEGSVNFHWTNGEEVTRDAFIGDRVIEVEDASAFEVGSYVWVAAANSNTFYDMMGVDSSDRIRGHMRQQIFQLLNVDTAGDRLTLDKALEFDLYEDSTADGSPELGGSGSANQSKVVPLSVVEGVGIQDLYIEQSAPSGLSPEDAQHRYENLDELGAMHGIVIKWSVNVFIDNIETSMTGSHPIVTEMARWVQIEDSTLQGAWNKGKFGNGYLRLSKLWDSLISRNVTRGLRHLTLQWSASGNLVAFNDLDSDINFHGGWERYNVVENNQVRVPFEHRECNPDCDGTTGTWYPLWWGAGAHAGGWSGASGPQNVVWNNTLQKQLSPGGAFVDYGPYGTDPDTLFMLGWDRGTPGGSSWAHLALNGEDIATWTHNETVDFHLSPNGGVNAQCTYEGESLMAAETLTCGGVQAPAPGFICQN